MPLSWRFGGRFDTVRSMTRSQPHRRHSRLAIFAAAAALLTVSLMVTGSARGSDEVMKDMAENQPPSWIKWLGWSGDGLRIAWREGAFGTGNSPGKPIWIARLNAQGAIVDRHYRQADVQKALDTRGIRRRGQAEIEELTPLDALVRTRAGEVLAVAVRGAPPVLAVLRRNGDDYDVVARRQVIGPVETLRVNAAESPDGRLLALVVHTGRVKRRQASLLVIPLQPRAQTRRQAELPSAVTPVEAAPARSKRPDAKREKPVKPAK